MTASFLCYNSLEVISDINCLANNAAFSVDISVTLHMDIIARVVLLSYLRLGV